MTLDHPTAEAAKRELSAHGYYPLYTPPEQTAQPWARPGDGKRLAVGCDKSGVWHIVPYPTKTNADWLD